MVLLLEIDCNHCHVNDWGHSSAGRAPAWHAGGQRFESAWLHSSKILEKKGARPSSSKVLNLVSNKFSAKISAFRYMTDLGFS